LSRYVGNELPLLAAHSSHMWKLIPTASLLNKSASCYKAEIDPAVSSGYERNVKPNLGKSFSLEFMVMEDDPSITDKHENHQSPYCLPTERKFPLNYETQV
jgi:hypothetical protein